MFFFFFFQAEDGIRDKLVTGVQTCALPIWPNGAGKEVIADVVQANSAVKGGPYVKVNVGALPDTLMESELFGTEAGAFTGAKARTGRFEAADGGTDRKSVV